MVYSGVNGALFSSHKAQNPQPVKGGADSGSEVFECYWAAVKELKLSYYIGGKPYYLLYIYIYTHYGNPKP